MAQLDPPPDHVVIEASGVALPGAIAATVSLLPGLAIDAVVVLADAETLRQSAADKYMGDTVLRQLEAADIVVLNKCDLVDQDAVADTTEWIFDKCPGVAILRATKAALPLEVLTGIFSAKRRVGSVHQTLHNLSTLVIEPKAGLLPQDIAAHLSHPAAGLLRAKGWACAPDGGGYLIQVVGQRGHVSQVNTTQDSGIVCIGMAEIIGLEHLAKIGKIKAAETV